MLVASKDEEFSEEIAGIRQFMKSCLADLGVSEDFAEQLVARAARAARIEKLTDGSIKNADLGGVATDWWSEVIEAWIAVLTRLDADDDQTSALAERLASIETLIRRNTPTEAVREWQEDTAEKHFETEYRDLFKSRDRRVFEQVLGIIGKRVVGEVDRTLTKELKSAFGFGS